MPPLIVYVLFVVFIAGPFLTTMSMQDYFSNPGTYAYLKNIALYIMYNLPGVFSANPYPSAVNGSLWTLPVEVFLYFAMPLVIEVTGLRKNTKRSHIILIAVCVIFCSLRIYVNNSFPDYNVVVYSVSIGAALRLISYFLIGSLFVLPEIKKLCNIQLASLMLLLFSCFQLSYVLDEALRYIVLSYFIFSLAFDMPAKFARVFSKCEISYGLYLYGFFVQQLVLWFFSKINIDLSQNFYLLICTVVSIVFGLLSYQFIEQPCLRIARKILGSRLFQKNTVY